MKNKTHYPNSKTRVFRALALASVVFVVPVIMSGCASIGVKPWQRDLMAKRDMRPVTHPVIDGMKDHINFSKEASTGGKSASGGGCGCN